MPPKRSPSPGKRKPRDPLTKRFTNGHKCFTSMQSKFMVEIMAKDEQKRLFFEDNKYVLKADRDPVNCELTARDNAPYLVKFDSSVAANTGKNAPHEETTFSQIETIVDQSRLKGSTQMLKVKAEVERCMSLRARRDLLSAEGRMCDQVLEHKKVCVMGGFTGTGAAPAGVFGAVRKRRPF
jgi:hypothetical protein